MSFSWSLLLFLAGAAAGFFLGRCSLAERVKVLVSSLRRAEEREKEWRERAESCGREREELLAKVARLEATLKEREAVYSRWRDELEERIKAAALLAFDSVRSDLLSSAAERVASAVSQKVSPLSQVLSQMDERLKELTDGVRGVSDLKPQVAELVKVLSGTSRRGKFGEYLLERVLEAAGLKEGLHYSLQTRGKSGGKPDCVVFLPRGGRVAIDSKFVLEGFKEGDVGKLVQKFREAVRSLERRKYAEEESTVGFAIVFIPSESVFYEIAEGFQKEERESLIDYCFRRNLLVATPQTLYAFLRTVALAWSAYEISENVEEMKRLLEKFYRGAESFFASFHKLGGSLSQAGKHYSAAQRAYRETLKPVLREIADRDAGFRFEEEWGERETNVGEVE